MENQWLLAVSDSHGDVSALTTVLEWVKSRYAISAAIFLGDGVKDLRHAAAIPAAAGFSCEWKIVRGNNDYEHTIPEAACMDFGGRRFFLCHGHRYSLYSSFHTLAAAARKMEADTALFGHLHMPFVETVDDILLINPGSISRPRSKAGSTFALIESPAECRTPAQPPQVHFWEIDTRGAIREAKIP